MEFEDDLYIRSTPILHGEVARRFQQRMNEKRTEDPKDRERRLRNYFQLSKGLIKQEQEERRRLAEELGEPWPEEL